MKRYIKAIFIIFILLFTVSCTSHKQLLSTAIPQGEYQELGQSECNKCSYLMLGLIPIKFDMPTRAYKCAVEKQGGDDLINPVVQESWYFMADIGSIRCTKVSGTVIKKVAKP